MTLLSQEAIDMLSGSVASEVYRDTGLECGHCGKLDLIGQRVVFTFKLGPQAEEGRYSIQIVPLDELKKAHSWQAIHERMVTKTLEDTARWALARKLAAAGQSHPPEIAPSIDQKGRRHFRMFHEPGRFLMKGT